MCVSLHKASVIICLFSNRRVINIEHNSSYIVCFTLYTIIVAVSIKIPTVATLQVKSAITLTHISSPSGDCALSSVHIENFLKFRRIEVRVDPRKYILGF